MSTHEKSRDIALEENVAYGPVTPNSLLPCMRNSQLSRRRLRLVEMWHMDKSVTNYIIMSYHSLVIFLYIVLCQKTSIALVVISFY